MKLSVLASGSSGNCFYIEHNKSAILVDAGISSKQISKRLAIIGKNVKNIKGIFITHEHLDHVKGVDIFARQFKIPIYVTKKTAHNCFLCSDESLINFIKNNETIKICGMSIEPFSKSHGAVDPISYSICNKKKISIITDLGYASKQVIENVSDSDFLCIESNYDISMLENGPYPYFLKQWIKSNKGHLSNLQASLCVLEYGSPRLKNIVLSHLSKINNTPQLALKTFSLLKERKNLFPKIHVSLREIPTMLFNV